MKYANFFVLYLVFFFFMQKTAYEMSLRDWSSDVCSSDLRRWCSIRSSRAGRGARAGIRGPASEIGRASCRERVCNDVEISVVAVSLKKKISSGRTRMELVIPAPESQPPA